MIQTGRTIQDIQKALAEDSMQDFFELQDANLWMKSEEELNEMFRLHQKGIGNFNHANYWSSNGLNNFNANAKSFITGGYSTSFSSKSPAPKHLVRLVRNI